MNIYTLPKRFLVLLFVLLGSVAANKLQAQQVYGNEWINHSQTYYKIRVINNGLHQLSYSYLDSLGLSAANPQHFQLFRKGREVSIYVAGESDGRLDASDYIEFYGERNNGSLDNELYKDPRHQIHQLRSLYTDTAAYFLTVATTAGKRMREVNEAAGTRTPEAWHLQKATIVNSDTYYRGKTYAKDSRNGDDLTHMPWMDAGEGYTNSTSRFPKAYNIDNITNLETSGPKPVAIYGVYARNNIVHYTAINVIPPGGTARLLERHTINGFGGSNGRNVLEFSDISSAGRVTLQTAPEAYPTTENQISIAFAQVIYPQRTIFSGRNMYFQTDSTQSLNPYFEFTGALESTVAYDITDEGNIVRIEGRTAGSKRGYVVSAENGRSHRILLANRTQPFRPKGAARVTFRNIDPNASNYIILTNKVLMQKVGSSTSAAPKEYAAYRASEAGGRHDTLLVYIDDLINQYHYGDYSANAIKRFLGYMSTSSRVKQMLILGKGVELISINHRDAANRRLDLVPSGGVPGSDILFSADFRNNSFTPVVTTGRVSATSAADIINYLNKVKEYEGLPTGVAWRKNILQLGGGTTVSEINSVTRFLRNYKNIVEGPLFGGVVVEKYRQSVSEVVESVNVADEINAGTSLVTFFGHTSASITDLDIGLASSPVNGYNNKGKYPVMLMNGCYAGNAFIPNFKSFGEDWVNTADKGAIAFIAHLDIGDVNALNNYSSTFYTVAFQEALFYGKPLGQIQQEVINRITTRYPNDFMATAMVLEMMLQGDPAVSLYAPAKPDYYIKQNTFELTSTDGSTITASTPELDLKIDIGNLGKAITDSVEVSLKRTLADNTVLPTKNFKVRAIIRDDTLHIKLNNAGVNALGLNTFEVQLNPNATVEELTLINNTARFQHYFPASGLITLSPLNYSVVNKATVQLTAQATELKLNTKGYYFELDTTQLFSSSLKKTYTADHALLPTWDVTLPASTDSTVYYWRVRFREYAAGEDTVWATSSFRYIATGKNGWSQSHYGQFAETTLQDIRTIGDQNLKWEFNPIKLNIEIRTAGGDIRYSDPTYGLIVGDRSMLDMFCSNPVGSSAPRMYMVVIDPRDLATVSNVVTAYACTQSNKLHEFGDLNNAANRAKIETFLKAVPEGYYVAAIGINKVPYESFTATQKAAFRLIGSSLFENLKNNHPYAIIGQKGAAPGTATELTATESDPTVATSQSVVLKRTLQSNKTEGILTSTVIGPALSWGTLHHNIENYMGGNDSYKLSVVGIAANGEQEVVVPSVNSKSYDLSVIDAGRFPSLQLKAELKDETARTAPQLKQWMVYFEAAPEGIIRPDLVAASEQVLTEQANRGSINMPMAFQNITPYAFKDSLTVEVTLSGTGIQTTVSTFKIAALKGNETANFNYRLSTLALDGDYRISMYVNPRLQPEQHYFNNIYEVPFRVNSRLHPILNVAFDGVHILDGELVSPSPLISIIVKDENRNIYLQDPSTMSLIMLDEAGNEEEISLLNNPQEVQYFPADEKNDFRVEYKPERLDNGKYTLEVRARDAAGKASGVSPYRIGFEVENEASVTNFYPYPNPFSTKTQFIFTLTGSTIPDDIKIQILTVTGKVIKEILKDELGPIRIGNNKTEYAWDGTDTYGDKLANGVYLYRVVMTQGEEQMKRRQKYGDKAFKNGYGKIYILR